MWEAITHIATQGNISVLICVATLVIVLVKTGTLHVKTDKVRLGVDNTRQNEREVLRNQTKFLNAYLQSKADSINAWFKQRHLPYSELRTELMLERVIDEVTSWCIFNHMNNSVEYVKWRTSSVRAIFERSADSLYGYTDDFAELYTPWVKELIDYLVQIRKQNVK